MSTINQKHLDVLVSSGSEIKKYRTELEYIIPPEVNLVEYEDLSKKLKSAIVMKESLSNSLASFLKLRKHYNKHSGYYENAMSAEAHALFTQGALFYRAGFVRGELVGRAANNLFIDLKDSKIHDLLVSYINKKIAHVDINDDIKSREICVSLINKDSFLEIGNVTLRSNEVHSYDTNTLEHIIDHIKEVSSIISTSETDILTKIKMLIGEISIYKD